MVKLDKQNRGGRKEEFANFKPSQKEFVGGGKVVRESRLEKKAKKVDEKYGNLEPHQVNSGNDQINGNHSLECESTADVEGEGGLSARGRRHKCDVDKNPPTLPSPAAKDKKRYKTSSVNKELDLFQNMQLPWFQFVLLNVWPF